MIALRVTCMYSNFNALKNIGRLEISQHYTIISNKFLWRDQLGAEKFERYDNMRMIERMKYSGKNAASLKVQLRSFK